MAGTARTALTTAQPIKCVKLTLPAVPVRASWLLRISRLTSSSFAGTTRKLVAVGTSRLVVMLETTRAALPRRGTVVPSSPLGTVGVAAGLTPGPAAGELAGVPATWGWAAWGWAAWGWAERDSGSRQCGHPCSTAVATTPASSAIPAASSTGACTGGTARRRPARLAPAGL